MRFLQKLAESSTILKCAKVLSKSEQRKIVLVICIQLFLSVLDLVGVAIVGILGALAVRGVQSEQPGDRVNMVLMALQIKELTFQNQMFVLGIYADWQGLRLTRLPPCDVQSVCQKHGMF